MLIFTIVFIVSSVYCDTVRISIKQGTLVGRRVKTNDLEYNEFLQVPYAKPPVGNLRFKSPEPAESWKGERNAKEADDKHICIQRDIITGLIRGSEDCLYLSLYTPISGSKTNKKPVILHIHPGGYIIGNGILKNENNPTYLLQHDVVVVFINYRLSVFGFLSLDIPEAAGNMGLKDQVMALKWVQENIEQFGGDKDNVMITGISAGSSSVEYLMLSPLSKGLFSKAIMLSGSALNPWAINYNIRDLSVALARELGCIESVYDNRAIYQSIINENSIDILTASLNVTNPQKYNGLFFGFVPSIEKDFGTKETFLSEYPYNLLEEGRFHKVPVMRGFCEFEGYIMLVNSNSRNIDLVINKKFTDVWSYRLHPKDTIDYNMKFKKVYVDDDESDKEKTALDFYGDFEMKSGILTSSKLMTNNGVDTYIYQFAYDGNLNLLKRLFNITREGAAHADDTGYIFGLPGLSQINITHDDITTLQRMTKMWTDFAKTGNPIPTTSDLLPIAWPVFDLHKQEYLEINSNLQVKTAYEPEKMAIFEDIYEKYRK